MKEFMLKTGVISSLLQFALLVLMIGCTSQPRNAYEIRETREHIYKGYRGPGLPAEQLAWVDWGIVSESRNARGYVVSIDNLTINPTHRELRNPQSVNIYDAAELLPGEHLFEYECKPSRNVSRSVQLKANISAGHSYRIRCDTTSVYAEDPLSFANEIFDLNSGELIAGRPVKALDWSWSDFQEILHELRNSRASRQKIIELFLTPTWPKADGDFSYIDFVGSGILDKDQTMVYLVCPSLTGVLAYQYTSREKGLVFLDLDSSDHLLYYYSFIIPDHNCPNLSLPPAWYSKSKLIEDQTCKYFSYVITIARYLEATGKFCESYLAIENAINSRTILTNNQLELSPDYLYTSYHPLNKTPSDEIQNSRQKALMHFFKEAKAFFEQNPTVIEFAKYLFKEEELMQLQQRDEIGFRQSIQKRLAIYGNLVSPEAFTEAQMDLRQFLIGKKH